MSLLTIQRAGNKHVPWIFNTILEHCRGKYRGGWPYSGAPFAQGIPNDIYYRYHHRVIEQLLKESSVMVLVNSENPDQFVGYSVIQSQPPAMLVHFLFVKAPFRNQGWAKMFLDTHMKIEEPKVIFYTHRTPSGDYFLKNLKGQYDQPFIYNPYLMFDVLPPGWTREVSEAKK